MKNITKNCNKGEGCKEQVNDLLTVANTFKAKYGGAAGGKWGAKSWAQWVNCAMRYFLNNLDHRNEKENFTLVITI